LPLSAISKIVRPADGIDPAVIIGEDMVFYLSDKTRLDIDPGTAPKIDIRSPPVVFGGKAVIGGPGHRQSRGFTGFNYSKALTTLRYV
jgi:hypothetical protein